MHKAVCLCCRLSGFGQEDDLFSVPLWSEVFIGRSRIFLVSKKKSSGHWANRF
jgi:hypothetical protein